MRIKIVNKFRFTVFLTLALLLVCAVVYTTTGGFRAYSKDSIDYMIHTVSNNESVWTIADKYNKSGEDVRKTVYEIKKANDIKENIIFVGQTLKIPK